MAKHIIYYMQQSPLVQEAKRSCEEEQRRHEEEQRNIQRRIEWQAKVLRTGKP